MTRYGFAVCVVVIVQILSCASAPVPDARDDAFDQHLSAIGQQLEAGTITRRHAAASARDKARELFADPYMEELWSYRVALADQVEKGRISLDQAAYLDQQKVNEIMERLKTSPAARAPAFRPTMTCRPDGYGGVRCR